MSSFSVSYRGKILEDINLPLAAPLTGLHTRLEELTGVPTGLQKLLWKGKRPLPLETSLQDAGIQSGTKIILMGSTRDEIATVQSQEEEARKRDAIMKKRAAGPSSKVRSTGTSSSPMMQYRFHRLEPLAHLPNPTSATSLLTKLSQDPAILHVMQQHKFAVGLLTELAPHEHPELLGLNQNAGEIIKLRLRTDAYDGFRLYSNIRMVLVHELTHNVHGDHDDKFKNLNSALNKEVAQFELSLKQGSHSLGQSGEVYEPASMSESGGGYTLGGGANILGGTGGSSREETRELMLAAAMRRMEEQEAEIQDMCGSGDHTTAA